jgi:hypothetical protein
VYVQYVHELCITYTVRCAVRHHEGRKEKGGRTVDWSGVWKEREGGGIG